MPLLTKFESQIREEWSPHHYPKVFVRETTKSSERLKIAASEEGSQMMLWLASVLGEPFAALYLLLVPRGGTVEGRYQSPWMSRSELLDLFDRFGQFWEQDGRHHLWLFSDRERATLVYDRHNVIFAYGPLEDYVRILEANGYVEESELSFPAPHAHHYHDVFDDKERELVSLTGWSKSSLREGDER